MDKKFIISVIVVFIVVMLFGFINHGLVLSEEYLATGLFRTEEDSIRFLPFLLLGHGTLAVAFVWLYRQGREDKPWLGQGIRFGLWIAVLMTVSIYLIYFAIQPMPGMLVVRQIVYDTIGIVFTGAAVAFIYR
jgi:hypothetical protein